MGQGKKSLKIVIKNIIGTMKDVNTLTNDVEEHERDVTSYKIIVNMMS